jgi:aminoglycoside phosphotransferase (APT) family kinase protein
MAQLTPREQEIVKEAQERELNRKPVDMTPINIEGTKWVEFLKDAKEIDPTLTVGQLETKYGVEHPIFTRDTWEDAKATDSTALDYWDYVVFWLEQDIAEEQLQYNLRSGQPKL